MLRRTLLPAIACLGLALAYVVPAVAQEEEGEDDTADLSFEQKLIHQFMTGLGAKSGRERSINYRERSPLVLPPQMTLPEPRKGGVAMAPNWPKDPEEQARRDAAELAKQPRLTPEEYGRPLLPSELAKGRIAASRQAAQPADNYDPGRPLLPSELGYRGGLFGNFMTPQKSETSTFTSEPPRNRLTAPPVGYQTPSSAYPYGIGPAQSKTASEMNPVGNTQR